MASEAVFPRFSSSEYARRYSLVKELLKRRNLQGLLVYSASVGDLSVNYLSGYLTLRPSYLVFPLEGEPRLILHFRNHIPCASAMSVVEKIDWHLNDPVGTVVSALREAKLEGGGIGIVGPVPYTHMAAITRKMRNTSFEDVTKEYNEIRWVRSEEEIGWFRRSARLTDLAFEVLEKSIMAGATVHQLNAAMHSDFLARGGMPVLSYISSTSMTKPRVFVPWQFTTDRRLRRGDVVITEISVGYYGYASQAHRPFAVGREPSRIYQELYEAALECYEKILKILRPGCTSKEVVEAGSIIEERGFTVYDSLVHGENGKNPELGTPNSGHPFEDFTFKENMVVTIQPQPVTKDLKAGIQLGSSVVVRSGGARSLHSYPLRFTVVPS